MNHIFPGPIRNLPKADIPLDGLTAYLSQSDIHQIKFDTIRYPTKLELSATKKIKDIFDSWSKLKRFSGFARK
jgi:hypothetical protein